MSANPSSCGHHRPTPRQLRGSVTAGRGVPVSATADRPVTGTSRTRMGTAVEPESITKGLWRRATSGDPAAYEQLFSMHTDRLLVFIRARLMGHLRGKIEPEDVLQDAYAAALRSFSDFEYTDEGSFVRWMCRIIDNRLRDMHDHFTAKKRQEIPLARSSPTGPVTALRRAENSQRIEQALSLLSPEHREVLLLRYFEGLTSEETGQRMNRSPGAVRNLAARALVELGRELGQTQKGESTC